MRVFNILYISTLTDYLAKHPKSANWNHLSKTHSARTPVCYKLLETENSTFNSIVPSIWQQKTMKCFARRKHGKGSFGSCSGWFLKRSDFKTNFCDGERSKTKLYLGNPIDWIRYTSTDVDCIDQIRIKAMSTWILPIKYAPSLMDADLNDQIRVGFIFTRIWSIQSATKEDIVGSHRPHLKKLVDGAVYQPDQQHAKKRVALHVEKRDRSRWPRASGNL